MPRPRPPTSRERPARWRVVWAGLAISSVALLSQCGAETFNLLDERGADAALSAGAAGFAGFLGTSGGAGRDAAPDAPLPSPCGFTPCPEAGAECPPGTQFCTTCSMPQDCQHQETPFCNTMSHLCVACLNDSTCPPYYTCNRITWRCDHACTDNNDCTTQPLCDKNLGLCVECINDSHCRAQPSKPFCWVGECVECFNDAGCDQLSVCVSFKCQHR